MRSELIGPERAHGLGPELRGSRLPGRPFSILTALLCVSAPLRESSFAWRNWQPLLADGSARSATGAVLIGADGLGPWEDEETQALLSRAVREGWTGRARLTVMAA